MKKTILISCIVIVVALISAKLYIYKNKPIKNEPSKQIEIITNDNSQKKQIKPTIKKEILNYKVINKSDINKEDVNVEQLKFQYDSAKEDYDRYESDFNDGVVTKEDLNNARKNLNLAEKKLIEAKEK